MNKFDEMFPPLLGEHDPKLIRAAKAIAQRNKREVTRDDIEDARAVFETLGMNWC